MPLSYTNETYGKQKAILISKQDLKKNEAPPPNGIGDCSKTHLCIDLKLFDFLYISKTKILKQKKIDFFTPPEGGTKKIKILNICRRA